MQREKLSVWARAPRVRDDGTSGPERLQKLSNTRLCPYSFAHFRVRPVECVQHLGKRTRRPPFRIVALAPLDRRAVQIEPRGWEEKVLCVVVGATADDGQVGEGVEGFDLRKEFSVSIGL
jgi:hypothetical protein